MRLLFHIARCGICCFVLSSTAQSFFAQTQKARTKLSKDGAEMVLIPGGSFQMGTDRSRLPNTVSWVRGLYPGLKEVNLKDLDVNAFEDETPRHTVYLDSFYIDKYEVTNEQYRKFVRATGQKEPEGKAVVKVDGKFVIDPAFRPWSDPDFNGDKQPVVCVSYEDAKAYAEWAGKRLPTEAEWEKAARGGISGRQFTWGDKWPPPAKAGNFAEESFKRVFTEDRFPAFAGYDDGAPFPTPVGSFTANGYGLFDMAGNAAEWVEDRYAKSYYANSPKQNPKGPDSGEKGVTRGGSWFYKWAYAIRVGKRESIPTSASSFDLGFRCARAK